MSFPLCLTRGDIGCYSVASTAAARGRRTITSVPRSRGAATSTTAELQALHVRTPSCRPAVVAVEPATLVAQEVDALSELSAQRSTLEAVFSRDYYQQGSNPDGLSSDNGGSSAAATWESHLPVLLSLPSSQEKQLTALHDARRIRYQSSQSSSQGEDKQEPSSHTCATASTIQNQSLQEPLSRAAKQAQLQAEQQLIAVAHDYLKLHKASQLLEAVMSRAPTMSECARFLGISPEEYRERWSLGATAVNQLLKQNKGLVAKIALSHANQRRSRSGLAGGVSAVDLMHAGYQGLKHAIYKYNPAKLCRLTTYATPWIKVYIARAHKEESNVVRLNTNLVDDIVRYNRVRQELGKRHGTVTHEQLCQVLGWGRKRLESAINAGALAASLSRTSNLDVGGEQEGGGMSAYESITEDDLVTADGSSSGVKDPQLQDLQLMQVAQTLQGLHSSLAQELQRHSSNSAGGVQRVKSKAARAVLDVMEELKHPRLPDLLDPEAPGQQVAVAAKRSSSSSTASTRASSKGSAAVKKEKKPVNSSSLEYKIEAHCDRFVAKHRPQLEGLLQESLEAAGGRMVQRSAGGAARKGH